MKPIFLIGYMGSGKTTIGKDIATDLKIPFLDLDQLIEEHYQKSISQIFKEHGESRFREVERNMLNKISDYENCIISTGGGTPCFFDNMEQMNNKGTTIFLDTSIDELVDRLYYEGNKRPLLQGKSRQQLYEYITQTLAERKSFYSKAKVKIFADDTNATTSRILQLIKTGIV